MRHIKQLMLITALITVGLYKVNAQDVSINILNQPAAVSAATACAQRANQWRCTGCSDTVAAGPFIAKTSGSSNAAGE